VVDNVTLNAGSGGVVAATDDVGGIHYQIVKISHGPLDTATATTASTPFPVDVGVGLIGPAKAEDSASANTDVGIFNLTVRQDTIASTTTADGDYQAMKSDSVGRVYVDASGTTVPVNVQNSVTIAAMPNEGQQTMANSISVAIASDQSAVPVSGTVTANAGSGTFTVSGTVTANAGSGTLSVDSELPAAAVLADNTANPTVPAVGAFLMAFDGTNWDRVQTGAATGGALKVDGSAVTQPVSGTITANAGSGTFTVSGTVTANAGSGTFTTSDSQTIVDNAAFTDGTSKVFMAGYVLDETAGTALAENDAAAARIDSKRAIVNTIEDGTTRGQRLEIIAANSASTNLKHIASTAVATNNGTASAGCQRVVIASDNTAFSVNAVQSGTWTVQPGNTANTTPWLVTQVPGTSPGSTVSRVKSAASTNATNLKGSAGVVIGWALYNNTTTAKYFKFYNKATSPTVGTDVPFFTVIIPAQGTASLGAGNNFSIDSGLPFSTGIGYAITGAITDADTTNTAADDVHGMILWK
jgi:hypothetical protein